MYHIHVDPALCKYCGFCIHFCKKDVLTVSEGTNHMGYHYIQAVHPENCVGCMMCLTMCGESAITMERGDRQ